MPDPASGGASESAVGSKSPATLFTAAELAQWMTPLQTVPVVFLAVSGGSDSLGLLHLYVTWRQAGFAPHQRALVVTIDHGLRPESRAETDFVGETARSLGYHHETLIWTGAKPSHGLQAAAREARYRLMEERANIETAQPVAIVTGHTADDQAETVLMHLARGSGVDGLAAMPVRRALTADGSVQLIRPLLNVSGDRLRAILTGRDQPWITDPSNADRHHERVRVRAALTQRGDLNISAADLSRTAGRMQRALAALEAATDVLEASATMNLAGVMTVIHRPTYDATAQELRIRLMKRVLTWVGGGQPTARLTEIERLCERLQSYTGGATLGGCAILPDAARIVVVRELGRDGLETLTLAPGSSATWDGRFIVELAIDATRSVTVRSVPPETWARWRRDQKPSLCSSEWLPTAAVLTLPSFWSGGELIGLALPTDVPGNSRHGLCIRTFDVMVPHGSAPATATHAAQCRVRLLGVSEKKPGRN